MITNSLNLTAAPIQEAVLDIDCAMPPKFDLAALEAVARDSFRNQYQLFQAQLFEEHQFQGNCDKPVEHIARRGLQAFQFVQEDRKQLIQIRPQGYSFNRLAPYSNLDDYLNEIERSWKIFVQLTKPVQVTSVRLRYINRIMLPIENGQLSFRDYLKVSPQLPDQSNLSFVGFVNQHSAVESGTGNTANIVLMTQHPEGDLLPLIFDIGVGCTGSREVEDWPWILAKIVALRNLKNSVFENTLTEKCLNLFRK